MNLEIRCDPSKTDFLKTGPPLVGIIINWWLFGILLVQYFIYFRYPKGNDNKYLRCVVYCLFALDTVQTIMTMVDAFRWFVYSYGDYTAFLETSTAGIDSPFMDGLIALIVQSVYAWRIRELSKWIVFPYLIGLFSLVGGSSGMVVGVYGGVIRTVPLVERRIYPATLLWLWSSVVTDILITVSMLYFLIKLKKDATSKTVRISAKRGIVVTLETNLLTTAFATAIAIMFVIKRSAPPSTNLHLAGGYILGKLNCFMVNLNQRIYYLESAGHNNTGLTELMPAEKRSVTMHRPSSMSAAATLSALALDQNAVDDLESGNFSTTLCEVHVPPPPLQRPGD